MMAFVDTAEQAAVETTKQMTRQRRSVEEKRRIVQETLAWIIREVARNKSTHRDRKALPQALFVTQEAFA